jgi:segregation and condensation protein B
VPIRRVGGAAGAVTVNYASGGGSVSPTNFRHVTGTVAFADGQDTAYIDLPLVDDAVSQNTQRVTLSLTGGTGGAVPTTTTATVFVLDNEPKEDVELALRALQQEYNGHRGLQFVEVAGGFQIVTRPELHEWVRRMFHERTTQKLSVQALETLAVIAYKQPITAAEITEIRGVNTSGVIGTLLERGLVKIGGRKQVVGRPFLYSTTRDFLDRFGLRDLSDLPRVEDLAGALGFEPPVGLAVEPMDTLPLADEPATEEDAAVLAGEGADDAEAEDRGDETP